MSLVYLISKHSFRSDELVDVINEYIERIGEEKSREIIENALFSVRPRQINIISDDYNLHGEKKLSKIYSIIRSIKKSDAQILLYDGLNGDACQLIDVENGESESDEAYAIRLNELIESMLIYYTQTWKGWVHKEFYYKKYNGFTVTNLIMVSFLAGVAITYYVKKQ